MNVNYMYFVHFIKQIEGWQTLRVLDFGCGNGEIGMILRGEGVECFGADAFYEGASFESLYKSSLFQEGSIRQIEGGRVPFEDGFFDVIISNQVFEHIRDKESAFNELCRVLKDDGLMYHHFPTIDSFREGHMGLPFVHWLPKGRLRFLYTALLRSLGLGTFKRRLTVIEWTKHKLDWLDQYCYYEKWKDLHRNLSKDYIVSSHEIEYCRFRARNNSFLRVLLSINCLKGWYEYLFRRFGQVIIELRKRDVQPALFD